MCVCVCVCGVVGGGGGAHAVRGVPALDRRMRWRSNSSIWKIRLGTCAVQRYRGTAPVGFTSRYGAQRVDMPPAQALFSLVILQAHTHASVWQLHAAAAAWRAARQQPIQRPRLFGLALDPAGGGRPGARPLLGPPLILCSSAGGSSPQHRSAHGCSAQPRNTLAQAAARQGSTARHGTAQRRHSGGSCRGAPAAACRLAAHPRCRRRHSPAAPPQAGSGRAPPAATQMKSRQAGARVFVCAHTQAATLAIHPWRLTRRPAICPCHQQRQTTPSSTAQHSTAKHSTAQPSAAQPSPAQPSPACLQEAVHQRRAVAVHPVRQVAEGAADGGAGAAACA